MYWTRAYFWMIPNTYFSRYTPAIVPDVTYIKLTVAIKGAFAAAG